MSYRIWTTEEENLLRELVLSGKYSYRQMEQFFPGRSLNSLTCHARQFLNIYNDKYIQHKYEYNQHFFDEPNPLNCYIAGFLAADGCIQYPKDGASPTLRLEVSNLDIEHLKKIKDVLKYTGLIQEGYKKTTSYFKMTVSKEYCDRLSENFGIIQNKTYHLIPPNLDSIELKLAFLIGLLDGDGCVHISNRNQLIISYTSSSENAMKWLHKCIESLNLSTIRNTNNGKIKKCLSANAYTICYNSSKAVSLIYLVQSFYKKHNLPILTRKWDNEKINQYLQDFVTKFPNFDHKPNIVIL